MCISHRDAQWGKIIKTRSIPLGANLGEVSTFSIQKITNSDVKKTATRTKIQLQRF